MFGKRMTVCVLAGAALLSGAWGGMALHAAEEGATPPPEALLSKIVSGLDLPDAEQAKLERMVSARRAAEAREAYRRVVRARLFEAAQKKLQTTMPTLMPTKIGPKVQAIRMKLRAGPPSATDIALIRMASQKRARQVMMNVMHETADQLADTAAQDNLLIAWVLAGNVRAKLAGEKSAAFDAAVKAAGITDREPDYIAKAEANVEAAIKKYDPDITGIIDPKTGAVTVDGEELGVPIKDKALEERIAKALRAVLAGLDLPEKTEKAVERMLAGDAIHAARVNYCMAVRARIFDAARKKLQALLPQKMSTKVRAKVMAIRTPLKMGGPPTQAERALIERAAMKRTRTSMMASLHRTADAVAVGAAKDENLVAAYLAKAIRVKLPADKATTFDAALKAAGITGDEAACLAQAEERIASIIETYDPDLNGIVDPKTGKVIAND